MPTMSPVEGARSGVTFIDLEFDTAANRGAPLGDIASSLVSLHDLLRDLATMAAHGSGAEFREIQVVAIEMRSPLTVKLSLLGIPAAAVTAFQDICRDIILFREGRSPHAAATRAALNLLSHTGGKDDGLTEHETQRLQSHITTLQRAEIALRRVVVRASAE
jgi:hypothetical protein